MRPVKPCGKRVRNYFLSNEELQQALPQIEGSASLHEQHLFFLTAATRQADALGFVFYGGNSFPGGRGGCSAHFRGPCGRRGRTEGELKRLAILRMDVDNLASVCERFAVPDAVLAHYACLSRSLDIFKGWLNTLRASNDAYLTGTYIIYAGGGPLSSGGGPAL
ncbi:MAG: hypothetical protein U0176_05075 [Bacteroidia bacterium]